MEKILPQTEIVFASKKSAISKAISRNVRNKQLRKLAPRIYTSNMRDPKKYILANNLYLILGFLFPNAVLSHRTALEGGVPADGNIILTYKYTKNIKLPGLTVRLLKGSGHLSGDTVFVNDLYLASRPRAFLENMQLSRKRSTISKSLSRQEIEKRLEKLCAIHGSVELNKLRDQAKTLSKKLNMQHEFRALDKLISAILGTHDVTTLTTEAARLRAQGKPYDSVRIELFAKLLGALKTQPLPCLHQKTPTGKTLRNLAFFEAYFSNYIEGTEFEINEAADIVFKHKIIPHRNQDAHDINSTYRIVSSNKEMRTTPVNAAEFIEILKTRHAALMAKRQDKSPGHFKEVINRAGNTTFVYPELVVGTCIKGFEMYQTLDPGIARAAFMMFMVAEIHPFVDGNGRIARIMMNAELVAANENRIIIPTVYREDYLLALRKLSRQQDSTAYLHILNRAQQFTASIDFRDYDTALDMLNKSNAFMEPSEGKLRIY